MTIKSFEYIEPKQLSEAVSALVEHGERAALLAGGTDLLVMMKTGSIAPALVVNLKRIPGLAGITAANGHFRLGALTTIRSIETSDLICERFPALAEAAGYLGSLQIRHLATVGGNLCRAAPCAETAPPLMALGAQVCLVGPEGERRLSLEDFFSGPGETVLAPGEILTEIYLPAPAPNSGATYLRHSIRPLMDLAIVNVAVSLVLDERKETIMDARVVLGSVAPTVIRAPQAEAALVGEPVEDTILDRSAAMAVEDSRPITDVRATDDYRQAMVRLFTRRALSRALARAKGDALPS